MSFAEIQQRERDEVRKSYQCMIFFFSRCLLLGLAGAFEKARRGEATAKGRNDGHLARGSFVQASATRDGLAM
jgi:hypothetical protein